MTWPHLLSKQISWALVTRAGIMWAPSLCVRPSHYTYLRASPGQVQPGQQRQTNCHLCGPGVCGLCAFARFSPAAGAAWLRSQVQWVRRERDRRDKEKVCISSYTCSGHLITVIAMALHTDIGLGDFVLMERINIDDFIKNLRVRWVVNKDGKSAISDFVYVC